MGADFTGGGFEQLAREAEKLKADAARLRSVTQQATQQTATDEQARRRLADRARSATSRTIAQAETIIQRGGAAARVTGQAAEANIAGQARQMDRLAVSAERALRPMEGLRRYGPFAWGRAGAAPGGPTNLAAMQEQYAQMARTRAIGAGAAPYAATQGAALAALSRSQYGAGAVAPPGGGGIPPPQQMTAYSAGMTRAATAHSVLNAQMERHGALSSEFIQQLARGNVGLRELGSQLVVTAGKFGGWLAAGGAIFALLGTLGAVGGGAIDAATGVNQLRRVIAGVDTDKAQQGFRDLANEFNLPIEQVAAAQYEMGKVFNDQAQSLEAARIVLAGVKVGELDVATSARYLTSITQGFNLEADQMSDVFGQINTAQNEFGLNIQDTTSGMAKAAGTASTLGGSTEAVLAFFTAARRGSGQSGEVIGTAVQRMSNFLNQNKEDLKQYGIDVENMELDEILEKAFEVAPSLDRQELIKLSQSLGGSFYGPRVFLPALRQGEIREQALGRYEGAGEADWQKELETTLENASEILVRIGTQLGILGSNLASSGFLDLLLLGIQALGDMLQAVNFILEVFNLLPEPLRHALTIAAQLYAVFRLMRRFNMGSTLPGAAGRAFQNPRNPINDEREAIAVRRTELSEQLIGASNAVTRAEIAKTIETERVLAEAKKQAGSAGEAARVTRDSISSHEDIVSADQRIRDARLQEAVIARERERTVSRDAELRATPTRARAPWRTPPTGRPRDVLAYIDAAQAQSQFRTNLQQYGPALGTMRTAAAGVRTAATRVAAGFRQLSFRGAVARMRGAGSRMMQSARGMVGMLGPLDAVLIGVGALAGAIAQSRGQQVELTRALETIQSATSAEDIDSAYQGVVDQIANENLLDDIAGIVDGNRETQQEIIEEVDRQRAKIATFRVAVERTGQGRALSEEERGTLAEGTFPEVYQDMATDIRRRIDKKLLSYREGERMMDALVESAWESPFVDDPRALADELRGSLGEGAQRTAEQIKQRAELRAAEGPLYDPVGEARRAADTARQVLRALEREKGEQEAIGDAEVEVAQAERAVVEAQNERAKALLQARGQLAISEINPENAVARSRQEIENARKELSLLRRQGRPREEILGALAALNEAEFARDQAIRDRALEVIDIAARMREADAPLYAPLLSEQTALWAARRKLETLRRRGGSRSQVRDAIATVAESERALALAANDRARSLVEASGEIALARIDPERTVAVAQQTLRNARNVHSLVVAQGRDQEEVMRAYVSVLQAESQLRQAIEERAEGIHTAQLDILRARAEASGNEVRIAALAARDALYALRHADTRQETLEARASLIRARTSRREAIFSREVEDIEFQADIGKLTLQQQISAYERLLNTLTLTRDMRRDLRRRIYGLREELEGEDGFDLAVGNIKLPTIYEIRRAMQGGLNQQSNVQVNNSAVINVNGAGNPASVAQRVSDALGQSGRAALRSAGLT